MELVRTAIDANERLANNFRLQGRWVVVEYQQFAENGLEDCHGVGIGMGRAVGTR